MAKSNKKDRSGLYHLADEIVAILENAGYKVYGSINDGILQAHSIDCVCTINRDTWSTYLPDGYHSPGLYASAHYQYVSIYLGTHHSGRVRVSVLACKKALRGPTNEPDWVPRMTCPAALEHGCIGLARGASIVVPPTREAAMLALEWASLAHRDMWHVWESLQDPKGALARRMANRNAMQEAYNIAAAREIMMSAAKRAIKYGLGQEEIEELIMHAHVSIISEA